MSSCILSTVTGGTEVIATKTPGVEQVWICIAVVEMERALVVKELLVTEAGLVIEAGFAIETGLVAI